MSRADTAVQAALGVMRAIDDLDRDLVHAITTCREVLDTLADLTTEEYQRGGDREARTALVAFLARMGAATDDELREYATLPNHGITIAGLDAGECDGDCTDGEAAEALEDDRDELSATIERLYDGINAAIDALGTNSIIPDLDRMLRHYTGVQVVEARRILHNLAGAS